uniref:NAD(P)-dependent oxidoreductase n=1 Tax=Staphylococcus capitis TaxID=29388 RepID=UPI0028CB8BFD
EVYGKTVGVMGGGGIGVGVGKRGQSFGMKILGLDGYLSEEKGKCVDIENGSVDEIGEEAELVRVDRGLRGKRG